MKLQHSARTDVGRTRDHNEDNYGVGESAQIETLGSLFVVCDGMGGHAAGEVASSLGVEMILNAYYETPGENRAAVLEQAFERANLLIHSEGRGTMGTTGVAALLFQDVLHIANVGDSRAYLIRNGTIHQISRDHSLVSDQVAAGLVTPEQARSVHYRNVITRALGYQQDVVVDLFRWPLQVNDLIVLSSDGLHGLIEDAEIAKILISGPLANTVEQLVDLANERGGTDNITAVAIVVETLDWDGPDDDDDQDADPNATTQPVPIPLPIPPISAPPAAQHIPPAPILPPEATPATPAFQTAPVTPIQAAAIPQPRDRRLTPLGGLLAAIVLIALVTLIFVSMNANPAQLPPPPPPAPTTISAPTNLPLTPTTASPLPTAPTTPTIAP
jgi:protein phosphatase